MLHQCTADYFILHNILLTGDMCFTYKSVFNFCDSPSGHLSSLCKRRYQVRFSVTIGLLSSRSLLWTPFCCLTQLLLNYIIIFVETDLSWLLSVRQKLWFQHERSSSSLRRIRPAAVERDISRKLAWTSRDDCVAFSVAESKYTVFFL